MKKRPTTKSAGSSGTLPSKETILFAVTGMSPAILTETVWALAHETPSALPSRVVVVTTLLGRAGIVRELLEPRPDFSGLCAWDAMVAALKKKGIKTDGRLRFGSTGSDILVFAAHDLLTGRTRELEDIRTKEENEAVAGFLLETLRSFTENEDCRVVASIAGGRKTMGALLYACMSLLGRESDRLTHVLVNDPFDDPRLTPRFYFPGQPVSKLLRTDGKSADARKATISLADVPFVTLRNLFKKELRRLPGGFSALVQSCRNEVAELSGENLHLTIHQNQTWADINGRAVHFTPREHLVLLYLAQHANQPLGEVYSDLDDPLNVFREATRQARKDSVGDWRGHESLKAPVTESSDDIRKLISSLRGKLSKTSPVGARVARALPERGRISLDLSPSSIRILPQQNSE